MTPRSTPEQSITNASRIVAATGDHDMPYVFGRRPQALAPFPFSTRELARLMVLRSRIQAGVFGQDDITL